MQASADIRTLERNVFINAITKIKSENKGFKFILVVDTMTLPAISALISTTELIEHNVILTELYEKKREPFPMYQAIYLLHPCVDIKQFIADFSDKTPLYAAAHLLFTYTCLPSTMSALESHPEVVNHILTFLDLWIHYQPTQPGVFMVPSPRAYKFLYSPNSPVDFNAISDEINYGLISFFLTIKAIPSIAYPKSMDKIKRFCTKFNDQLMGVTRELDDGGRSLNKDNTLLLIIPRGADPITPLLHRFTYQSMIYENFPVENDCVYLKEGDPNSVVALNPYEDKIFNDYCYKHFQKFIEIRDLSSQVTQTHKIITDPNIDKTSQKYAEAMKRYIRDQSYATTVSNHLDICIRLDEALTKRCLADISKYEQQLAAKEKDGSSYKPNLSDLQDIIIKQGPEPMDKLRALAVYQLSGGKISDTELERLLEAGSLTTGNWKDAILNLKYLGDAAPRQSLREVNPVEEPFVTDIYYPYAAQACMDAIDGKLDKKCFEIPTHTGRYTNVVLFFFGGVSFAELEKVELLRQRMKSTKIYVGATNTLTPRQFLAQTRGLTSTQ
ncbi:Sec1 family protein [Trichomonas vaginalis G3]|uniref:Sec1 family protein n=1 Tax=Trichomonas vaginalis (strain ATCC PRA-98 / G3) TaxID=412133 RepID=A2EDX4_TRIV3|nr:vesicle docking involved in exocytosis [Trichomonas vaginalis G3]EAY09190.1 Sec1 family protein [Trichomonas vaginalis G3]KAI5487023.1 vesicle docking involved in exocytosis [Trichomonas vaginalis G3]|eukprot:XP_001321413.1 Sec1 family protein [Trichomonas vaginalis G3]